MDLYAQDGVDVGEGDSFSAFAGGICRESFGNSPLVKVVDRSDGHFRGVRSFRPTCLPPEWSMDMTTDGVGTKVIISDAAMMHVGSACDLVAMCCGDITRNGGCPVVFNNDLSVASLGKEGDPTNKTFRQMITELGSVAARMKLVLFRGETAEVGVCVGTDNPAPHAPFVWSGTAMGVYLPDLMITGNSVEAGDQIVAIKENGFRANGISSVRAAFAMRYGQNWFKHDEAQEYIRQAAVPSALYDPLLTHINGWWSRDFKQLVAVKQLIHVTGGAFSGKLGDDFLFQRGLSAHMPDLFDPPEIMKLCKDWRGMSDSDCYNTWNGGQGVLAVLSPEDVDEFLTQATGFGYDARVCGEVTESDADPSITIVSKFDGETITYA